MVKDSQKLLKSLATKNGKEVLEWLDDVKNGEKEVPIDFNWLGLAEIATDRAFSLKSSSDLPDLDWARAGIIIYENLANKCEPQTSSQESLLISSMYIRVRIIIKVGVVAGDKLRDPQIIVDWFFSKLALSLDEVKLIIPKWKESLSNLKELRRIKNRLTVIKTLCEEGVKLENQEIYKWLILWRSLP